MNSILLKSLLTENEYNLISQLNVDQQENAVMLLRGIHPFIGCKPDDLVSEADIELKCSKNHYALKAVKSMKIDLLENRVYVAVDAFKIRYASNVENKETSSYPRGEFTVPIVQKDEDVYSFYIQL